LTTPNNDDDADTSLLFFFFLPGCFLSKMTGVTKAMALPDNDSTGTGTLPVVLAPGESTAVLTISATNTDCQGNSAVSRCKFIGISIGIVAVTIVNYVAIPISIAVTITATIVSSAGLFS
jgi:hypothetical protein